ncbi:mammalian cell entry protein [Opitutaceae bacterium TAV5]|nr:mammalian cell entry protein [Opitutaceae bacterium TAV5]
MKTKVSPAIIGFFVLGAIALGIIALLSFGGFSFFRKPERFIVYFDESIQGLDVGSPVKIRGMRVGRVADVQIRHSPGGYQSYVAVTCEMNRDKVASARGTELDISAREKFEQLVNDGLRAQLGILGLATGMLYVELDFFDPAAYPPALHEGLKSPYLEVPAIPSTIAEFQANLSDILREVRNIKFGEIGKEVHLLIADVRTRFNEANTSALVQEWTRTATSIRTFAESPELRQTVASLNAASAKLDTLLGEISNETGPLGKDVSATLADVRSAIKEFTAVSGTLRQFMGNQQHVGTEAGKALARLSEAAEAIGRLADFLERNPTALISGRPPDLKLKN